LAMNSENIINTHSCKNCGAGALDIAAKTCPHCGKTLKNFPDTANNEAPEQIEKHPSPGELIIDETETQPIPETVVSNEDPALKPSAKNITSHPSLPMVPPQLQEKYLPVAKPYEPVDEGPLKLDLKQLNRQVKSQKDKLDAIRNKFKN